MKQLLEAGVHFGHQTRRWNPKMRRYIFGERNGIYIIDLQQTLEHIETAYTYLRDMVADGGTVLFVGTKKQTQDPVARYAQKCGMPYVIPGNDDAIRAGTLMCRIVADAVDEGRFIASRRAARPGTTKADVESPVEDEEAERRRAQHQAEARRQAALQAQEREARVAA